MTNIVAQGFYSDGRLYEFRCIKEDGTVMRSSTFNITYETGLKMVFRFTVAMLETAMKSTPEEIYSRVSCGFVWGLRSEGFGSSVS